MKHTYELITPEDTRLNTISSKVQLEDIATPRVQKIVSEMTRIAHGERDEQHPELPSLVGLAAPQIGIFERIILFDAAATRDSSNFSVELKFLINPEITEASSNEELGREGCYSTGDIGGAVNRSKSIKINGLNEHGEPIEYELEDFMARIVQHEVDHLNGIRFPDRVRQPKHLHAFDFKSEEFQHYREEWMNWKKLYSFDDWLKVKNGDAS